MKKLDLIYRETEFLFFDNSLGVNILNTDLKICSFNCPYCDLGPTTIKMNQLKAGLEVASPNEIALALKEALLEQRALGNPASWIEISGNGDPSTHPQLREMMEVIEKTRTQFSPGSKIAFLTNGASLDSKKSIHALEPVDNLIIKLDAGNDTTFSLVNKPLVRVNVSRIISACKKYKNVSLQSMFFQGDISNIEDEDVDDWTEVVGMIQPQNIYLTTLKEEFQEPKIKPVTEDFLYTLQSKLKRRFNIEVEVLY